MKRTLLALALAATSLPLVASAAELNYSYIEGGYTQLDADDGAPDADGLGFNGSVAISESFFLFGGYSSNEIDGTPVDVDVQRLGLGWHNAISERTDLVLGLNYLRFDLEQGGFGIDANGYEAEVGVRHAFGQRFEGQAMLGYVDGGDFNGSLYGKLGGEFKFNEDWSLVGSALLRDDVNEFFVGPRLNF